MFVINKIIPVSIALNKSTCELCLKTFKDKSQLTDHIEKNEGNSSCGSTEPIKCKLCLVICPNATLYIRHYQKTHGSLPPEYSEKELLICEQCPKMFVTDQCLKNHIKTGHSNVPKKGNYNCTFEDCGYTCNLIRSMNRHVIRFHKKSESLQTSVQKRNGKGNKKDKFECKPCCVKFQSATKYIHHYQTVHDGIPPGMAIPFVEFSCGGYRIGIILA